MAKGFNLVVLLVTVALVALLVGACAAPAPTPTPTAKAVAVAPTPAKPQPTPTPEPIRWVGGKLQPLPDGFPKKEITLVAPPAGSSTDVAFRTMAKATQPFSPVPIVVVNNGEGSDQAFAYARDRSKEGYFLSEGTGSMMVYMYSRAFGITPKDFKAVYLPNSSPIVVFVRADAPWKSLSEVIQYSKENPGKVRATSGGGGNWNHLIAAWIPDEAKVDWTIIPAKSSGEANLNVLGGGAEVGVASMPSTVPNVQANKVRLLGTVEPKRLSEQPDVPTLKEQGFDIVYAHFTGFLAPAEASEEHILWLSTLFSKGASTPEYQAYIKNIQGEFLDMGPKEAQDYIAKLDTVAARLTQKLGLRAK